MSVEARKVHRLLALQQQLHRIEEWKLADLERTLDGLDASQQDIIRALNEDDALQGLFIDATARRLQSLAEEASRVREAKTVQSAKLLEQAVRKACAERMVEAVDLRVAQAADKKELLDAIEHLVGPAAQASRKIVEG